MSLYARPRGFLRDELSSFDAAATDVVLATRLGRPPGVGLASCVGACAGVPINEQELNEMPGAINSCLVGRIDHLRLEQIEIPSKSCKEIIPQREN